METPTTSPAGRLYSHDSWLLNSTDHHFSWATSKKREKKKKPWICNDSHCFVPRFPFSPPLWKISFSSAPLLMIRSPLLQTPTVRWLWLRAREMMPRLQATQRRKSISGNFNTCEWLEGTCFGSWISRVVYWGKRKWWKIHLCTFSFFTFWSFIFSLLFDR